MHSASAAALPAGGFTVNTDLLFGDKEQPVCGGSPSGGGAGRREWGSAPEALTGCRTGGSLYRGMGVGAGQGDIAVCVWSRGGGRAGRHCGVCGVGGGGRGRGST